LLRILEEIDLKNNFLHPKNSGVTGLMTKCSSSINSDDSYNSNEHNVKTSFLFSKIKSFLPQLMGQGSLLYDSILLHFQRHRRLA
jgi:hypothetical protein